MKYNWSEIEQQLANLKEVEGGFSPAQRGLITLPDGTEIFVKIGLHENTKKWAKKELAVYTFLKKHNYPHIPKLLSTNVDQTAFATEALIATQGWNWQNDWDDDRVEATLKAMNDLTKIQLDEDERNFFSEKTLSQEDNGWKPLLESEEKQKLLVQKLKSIAAKDIAERLNFSKETSRSEEYIFADDSLVHYDIRADNCAWNKERGEVKIVDWNWTQLGDRDVDIAATLTNVKTSGHDLIEDLISELNPDALHWLAGYWFNSATNPIWPGGPENLRDFQLLSGVTALRLEQEHANLKSP